MYTCKHCGEQAIGYQHVRTNLGRCQIDPYGYNAEPVGTECANPCIGSRA